MNEPQRIELAVPSRVSPAELADFLEQALGLSPTGRQRLVRVYYDSFEGRLGRAGFWFAVERTDEVLAVVCAGLGSTWHEPIAIAQPPRFAEDLPSAPWRTQVAGALECRALLPKIELALSREVFVLEDARGEALLRAVLELPALDAAPLSARLWLVPAKGERKRCRHAMERLAERFGLAAAPASLYAEALATQGAAAREATALPCVRLDPGQRADAATKQILLAQLAAIRLNEAGTLAQTDTEFLHDFRVAVRRTRAALGQIKAVFPEATTARYAQGFAELGRITGDPRDLDVYLLEFERHREELPEALRADLEPLRALLLERAQAAHAHLNEYLAAPGYRRLLQGWERFLQLPPPAKPRARNAALPIAAFADRRIWKLYRRVVAEGLAITPESPPEQIHDLRKTAKKLRYLMEFFRGLYPPDKIGPLIKILKDLQEHLGAYQDVHAQIAQLRRFADDLREAGAPTAGLLALGALLERRYAYERELRTGFAACFAGFAEAGHRRRFRRLFRAGGGD